MISWVRILYPSQFRSTALRCLGSSSTISTSQLHSLSNDFLFEAQGLKTLLKMTHRLSNKVAIITGSSSGLGRAISLHYAREGAKIVCSDLKPSARLNLANEQDIETHTLIKQEGGEAVFVKADVGIASEMEALVQAAVKEYGRVDM